MKHLILVWIFSLLLPVTMIFLSLYYYKKAKGEPSKWSGFRTTESMKTQESWRFAHMEAAKYLIVTGVILTIMTILNNMFGDFKSENVLLLNVGISLGAYILITLIVNNKVKNYNNSKL